jgi:hypothetical protein
MLLKSSITRFCYVKNFVRTLTEQLLLSDDESDPDTLNKIQNIHINGFQT